MNEVHCCASGKVQRAARKVADTIDGSGHPAGHLVIPLSQETTMLKTISAVLLAVSVLAAPALAANPGKATQAPVAKTEQAKPNLRSANAKMIRHHRHHRHHRFHKRISALKTHQVTKLSVKHTVTATKRG